VKIEPTLGEPEPGLTCGFTAKINGFYENAKTNPRPGHCGIEPNGAAPTGLSASDDLTIPTAEVSPLPGTMEKGPAKGWLRAARPSFRGVPAEIPQYKICEICEICGSAVLLMAFGALGIPESGAGENGSCP